MQKFLGAPTLMQYQNMDGKTLLQNAYKDCRSDKSFYLFHHARLANNESKIKDFVQAKLQPLQPLVDAGILRPFTLGPHFLKSLASMQSKMEREATE